jgi:site-specific recombinase XerD
LRDRDLQEPRGGSAVWASEAFAKNTQRAYRTDWNHFADWCDAQDRVDLPAEPATLAAYVDALAATHKASTIQRHLVSISKAHRARGVDTPTTDPLVKLAWRAVRRRIGVAQEGKAPLLTNDVRAMVAQLPATRTGLRDRALLLVGFSGAFRRSELVALTRRDLEFTSDGVTVRVRRSKTDPEARGRKLGIPFGRSEATCPVRALRAWLDSAKITTGPVFRGVRRGRVARTALSDKAVAFVVKRAALAVGLDPARYAGHSLRAGLATAAAIGGASERSIMKQTGHQSEKMVRRYIRDAELYRDNAAAATGL